MPSFVFGHLLSNKDFKIKSTVSKLFHNFSFEKTGKDFGIDGSFILQKESSFLLRYIFTENKEIMTLEGPISIRAKIDVPVLIDFTRKLFFIFSTIKKRQKVILDDLMEGLYNSEYRLECVILLESIIRKIADESEAIIYSSHKTPSKTPLLNVAGAGFDLRETNYWESYGQDPLNVIKLFLIRKDKNSIKISFKLNGSIITVHGRNMSDDELVKACEDIADYFLLPHLDSPLFQTTMKHYLTNNSK